ncbi:MAG TPA: asparagine synthase-related protein [Thermoleophilaceae bacterium]
MTAICGVVGLDGRRFTEDALAGTMAALAPLGREGGATWSGSAGPLGVAVGAALRTRTPEDAGDSQPVFDATGSIALVGDLRIDNRAELAGVLGVPHGSEVPDSAIALAAYGRWGNQFLERVVGAFALAVLDVRRGTVLLARDHLGLRPLVVHERPGVLAFASTALSLTALEGVGHRLDMRRAAEVVALAYNSERTFVEGVRWVPPAGAIAVTASGVRRWSWWRPERIAIRQHEPPEVFERELREALELAVGSQLRSPARVGAMVSGGLDSTSVAATAARMLAPRTLPTYTSAPRPGWSGAAMPGLEPDETPLVLELAALHPTMTPAFVHIEPGHGLLDHHERLWELGAGPARNPCNAIWVHEALVRAASDDVTTLLTGNLGNYFFSAGGSDWLVALLRAGRFTELGREVSAWSRRTGQSRRSVLRQFLLGRLPLPALRRLRASLRGGPERASNWVRGTALKPEAAAEIDLAAALPQLDQSRPRDARADTLATAMTASTQAENDLATEALFGVDLRDPTADRRVIEAALVQPEWVRRRRGVGRAVARGAMVDRLPRSIRAPKRRGEQLPDWLDVMSAARGELAAELEAMAGHEPSRELIDLPRLRRLFDAWPERDRSGDPALTLEYRYVLFRAVVVSRYMRWFERHSPAARVG